MLLPMNWSILIRVITFSTISNRTGSPTARNTNHSFDFGSGGHRSSRYIQIHDEEEAYNYLQSNLKF